MEQGSITITVRFAGWVWPYVNAVKLFAWTFGLEPDVDKVLATASRGIRVGR